MQFKYYNNKIVVVNTLLWKIFRIFCSKGRRNLTKSAIQGKDEFEEI